MKHSTPKTQKILLRLGLLTFVGQIIGIVTIFLLSSYLAKLSSISHLTQATIFITLYFIFNFLSLAAVIVNALRPVRTIENYFSAKNNNILVSNNLSKLSVINDLIGEVADTIDHPEQDISHQSITATNNSLIDDHANYPIGLITIEGNGNVTSANQTAFNLLNISNSDNLSTINQQLGRLKFSQPTNLAKWVAELKSSKIRDEKNWKRVYYPTTVNQQPAERIFDIIARYDKSIQSNNIYLAIIDNTVEYENDSNSVNLISIATHELRAPITIINGLVDTLKRELAPSLTPDRLELFQRIETSVKKLSSFVNNMLTLARTNQNGIQTTLGQENWTNLLNQITNSLRPQVESHGQYLDIDTASLSLPNVLVDKIGIEHVLTNLIDNATKYGKPGNHILVSSKQVGDFVETTITDQGIGIPEALMGNLFTKFYRSHRSKQAVSGTGIGLYLCKTIIDMHGGEIWIKSTEGQGTTVGFTLQVYTTSLANSQQTSNNIAKKESNDRIQNHSLNRG